MTDDVAEKIENYEIFLNDVLKEDLKKVFNRREKVVGELAEWAQLKNSIESIIDLELESGFKSKMNLGCDFYVQANVPDTKVVFIDVGLGHYLEFSLRDALKFIDKRASLLQEQVKKLAQDSADIKATIKVVLLGIDELQNGGIDELQKYTSES